MDNNLFSSISGEPISFSGEWMTGREFLLVSAPQNITFKFNKKGLIAWIQRLFKNKNGWQEISMKAKIGKCEYSKNEDGSYSVSVPMSIETD